MFNYGKRLKKLRQIHNLSANKLAKKVNLDPTHIYKIEKGTAKPSLNSLEKICNALNISLNEFFDYNLSKRRIPLMGTVSNVNELNKHYNNEGIHIEEEIPGDFALKIKDDNMVLVGITKGDIAILDSKKSPTNGQIVATIQAEISNYPFVSFYEDSGGHVLLRSSNPDYDDIKMTDNHKILGCLCAIIKKNPHYYQYKKHLLNNIFENDQWQMIIDKATEYEINPNTINDFIEYLANIKNYDQD